MLNLAIVCNAFAYHFAINIAGKYVYVRAMERIGDYSPHQHVRLTVEPKSGGNPYLVELFFTPSGVTIA